MSLRFLPGFFVSIRRHCEVKRRQHSIDIPVIMVLPAVDCIDKPVPVQAEAAIFQLAFVGQVGDGTELDELFHFGDLVVADVDLEGLGWEAGLRREFVEGHDALMRVTDITVEYAAGMRERLL